MFVATSPVWAQTGSKQRIDRKQTIEWQGRQQQRRDDALIRADQEAWNESLDEWVKQVEQRQAQAKKDRQLEAQKRQKQPQRLEQARKGQNRNTQGLQ